MVQPRREPLLWLQCLALGAIPLELLLIRLVLAGADPGPVPGVERVLIWGVGVLAPAVALWRRPADWGSLLLVRQPLASRSSEQLRISASLGGFSSRIAVVIAAVILLPVLWWLDDSAVLASEFSPVSGQSRLVTLLLVSPVSALIVWQLQQLVQAAHLLIGSTATVASADSACRTDALASQQTSLGLQLLNLPALEWPEPPVQPSKQGADEAMSVEDTESETDTSSDQASTEEISTEETSTEHVSSADNSEKAEPEEEGSAINLATVDESADAEAKALDPVEAGAQAEEMDPTSDQESDEVLIVEDAEPERDDNTGQASTEETSAEETSTAGDNIEDISDDDISDNEEPNEESSAINPMTADVSEEIEAEAAPEPVVAEAQDEVPECIGEGDADQSTVAAAASVPVEPEQPREEQESTALDAEIRQVDRTSGGSTESHREQAESSGSKEGEPEQSSEPPPGGL